MIDINSLLAEKTMRTGKKFADELVADTFNLIESDLVTALKNKYTNFDVVPMPDRALSKDNNLLVFIMAKDTFTNEARNKLTDDVMNQLVSVKSKYLYDLKRAKLTSYSKTIDTITVAFKELGTVKNMKFRFVVKPGEDVAGFTGFNNVRNSDLTEITPIVLFELFNQTTDLGRAKLQQIVDNKAVTAQMTSACSTVFDKIRHDSSRTDFAKKYHAAQFDTLFSNLNDLSVYNQKAIEKFIAGVRLYLLLIDTYETDTTAIRSINLEANKRGYDTVADIAVLTKSRTGEEILDTVPVSIKSYDSVSESVKLKSVAWYRLINNDVTTLRRTEAIPSEYSTDVGVINASKNILSVIQNNLKNDARTRSILKTMILGKDTSTIVINTSSSNANLIDKLNDQTVDENEFINCELKDKTLKVITQFFTFNIEVRFRSSLPTVDIYCKEISSSVTN